MARLAAEELQTAVRARDAAMTYESARGAALESGVDALSSRLRTIEVSGEARVAEWITERRRLQHELRRATEANAALQTSYSAQLARAVKLRERLDTVTLSLRFCPPADADKREALPVRQLSPPGRCSCSEHCAGASASSNGIPSPAADASGGSGGCRASSSGSPSWDASDAWVPAELFEQLQREVRRLRMHYGRTAAPATSSATTPCEHTSHDPSHSAPTSCARSPPIPSPGRSPRTPARSPGAAARASSVAQRSGASPHPSPSLDTSLGAASTSGKPATRSAPKLPVSWRR